MVTTATYPMPDPTAVVGRRVGAYVIDIVLVLLFALPVGVWHFVQNAEVVHTDDRTCSDLQSTDGSGVSSNYCLELDGEIHYLTGDDANQMTFLFYGVALTVVALDLVILQGLTGASLGKHVLGLRVVRMQDGERAGFGWVILRTLLLIVDAFCCFIPGLVLAISTKRHRRVGDMVAGTLVVDKRAVGHGPIPLEFTGSPGQPGTWAGTQSGGWGAPTGGAVHPPTQPTTPPGPPTTSDTVPGGDAPVWDEARHAYIQYDHDLAEWMQWDERAEAWVPISR